MAIKQDPLAGINSSFEDELRQQYRHDRGSVDPDWKYVCEGVPGNGRNGHIANGASSPATAPVFAQKPVSEAELGSGEELLVLRGAPGRIAENMGASVSVPLA